MVCVFFYVFFFKQKTAYELLRSLVGSEMCIRDSPYVVVLASGDSSVLADFGYYVRIQPSVGLIGNQAVSYTHLTLPTIYSV